MQKAKSLPCPEGMAKPLPDFSISNYLRRFLSIMLLLASWNAISQTQPDPIYFRWDSYVGCIEGIGDMRKTYEELLKEGLCHQVCQNSIVNYSLESGSTVLSGTTWQVIGGTILSQSANTCQVRWSSTVNTGSIGVTTNTPTSTIRFPEICVEMKIPPSAQFAMNGDLRPTDPEAPLVICRGTTVNFNNLSSAGNGTPLNSHYWNFGDGNYSTAFEPSHTFDIPGEYTVILTVTNQCFCKDTYSRRIRVTREAAVPITCASTVCEGERATYSVPASYRCGNFDWSVVGGTIVSPMPYGNTIVVDWVRQGNESDGEGFGYVTFNPERCDVSCHEPTTVKIPIIRLNGRINGKTTICGNSQELYKLPQWPTTDFQWEIVNSGGANATLMINGQRNEIMVDTGTEPGTFTLKARYHNTLLECGGTASITVTVKIPAIIEGPRVVCLGDNPNTYGYSLQSGHVATWKWRKLPSGPITTVTDTYVSPVFPSVGDYSIVVSGSIFCNPETYLVRVAQPATPLLAGFVSPTVICPKTPMELEFNNTVSGTTILWEVVGGTIIGSREGNKIQVTFDYPFSGTYAVKLTRKDAQCLSQTLTIPLQLPTIPNEIKGLTVTDVPVINSCGSSYQNYSFPFDEADSYEWSVDPPNVGSLSSENGSSTVEILWNEFAVPTTATLTLKLMHCGVLTTRTLNVTVGSPQISIAPTTTICSQNFYTFALVSNPPLASGTVTWDFGDGTTSTNPMHKYDLKLTSPTTYTVTATVTNPNGCNSTVVATRNVTVAMAPVANITPGGYKTKCSFSEFSLFDRTLTASEQTGYGGTTDIKWFKNGVEVVSGSFSSYPTYIVNDFGNYYAEVTNGTCSSRTNTVVFAQNCSEPVDCTLPFSPNLQIAASNNCGTITATASYNPSASATILWSNNSTGNTATYPFDKAGYYGVGYTVTYITSGGQLCKVSKGENVTIPYVADLKYQVICPAPGATTYGVRLIDSSNRLPSITGMTYKFYVNNSLVPYTTGPLTERLVQLAPGATYNLKVEIVAPGEAMCSKTIALELPAFPNANFNFSSSPYCQGNLIAFTVPGTAQPGESYSWSFNSNEFFNTQRDPIVTFVGPGTKFITLTIKNRFGCTHSVTKSLSVTAVNYVGTVQPTETVGCFGSSVALTYQVASGGTPAKFQWMLEDEEIPGAISNPYNATQPGRYWVKVGTSTGCFKDIPNPVSVTILPPVNPSIQGRTNICTNEYLTLTTPLGVPGTTYRWTRGGVLLSTGNSLSEQPTYGGTYTYNLEVKIPRTGGFCIGTATHVVTVYDAPDEPVITTTLVSCIPYRIKLTATATQPGYFTWSNGQAGNEITVTEGGPYQVSFTNTSGCSSSAFQTIPRSLESYLWIFPTGCYDYCSKRGSGRELLGPAGAVFDQWDWLLDGASDQNGTGEVLPYTIPSSGTYNLQLSNEYCNFTSEDLNISLKACENCQSLTIQTLENTYRTGTFNHYRIRLRIINTTLSPLNVSIVGPTAEGILSPATIVALPGNHIYDFMFVILPGFTAGSKTFTFEYDLDRRNCTQSHNITFAPIAARPGSNGEGLDVGKLSVAPNPASHSTVVYYEYLLEEGSSSLELYDLTGRLLERHVPSSSKGNWNLDVSHLASGQYVVVMKQHDQVLQQQRVLISK